MMMDKVQHFEIPVDDLDRAMAFYKETFGWHLQNIPEMQYTIIHTAPTDEKTGMIKEEALKEGGVINGGMMKRGEVKHPVITVIVEDIDRAKEKIEKNGGKMINEKMEIPQMGWSAYFKDSEGNVMGLFQNVKGMKK